MAYCLKCGAYIPDGQMICLACGYDPVAEQKKAEAANQKRSTGSAYQYSSKQRNQEMYRRLEEQRRRNQEQNRQWAEQERIHREEQAAREEARKEQQERDRAWAREEYERRQAEQRTQTAYDTSRTYRSNSTSAGAGEGNKALAALSYLSVLFALPYIFTPQDEYAKFHAKQGMKLFIYGILADILTSLIGLGWLATLARLYLIYKGITNALNGIMERLPYKGNLREK